MDAAPSGGGAGQPLGSSAVGSLTAALWVASGVLVLVRGIVSTFPPGTFRMGVVTIGLIALAIGMVVWVLPWERWPLRATLWLMPLALAMIALQDSFATKIGFVYAPFYFVVFVWLGIFHPPGMSLRFAPLLAVAYLLPLVASHPVPYAGLISTIYVVPICVMIGETIALFARRLRWSEWSLAESRERFRSAFEQAPIGMALGSLDGQLIEVNQGFAHMLGRTVEELRGASILEITYPDDRDVTGVELQRVVTGNTKGYQLEKRYRHVDGHAIWASMTATVVRDPSGSPLYMVGQIEDVTERRALRERLEHAALHDALTELPNRALFMDRLCQALRRAERETGHVGVIFIDVDGFKIVNDTLGHDGGDQLLRSVAARLNSAVRQADTVARVGGDEFAVVCETANLSEATEIAERLVAAMRETHRIGGVEHFVSISVGLALSDGPGTDGPSLLRRADVAMFQAKQAGRDRVEIYQSELDASNHRRLETTNELHRAVGTNAFRMHYQPIVDLQKGAVVGLEALIRWNHPSRGLLPPAEFIEIAEDSGLIVPIGLWVLEEACHQMAHWNAARAHYDPEKDPLTISINVSARQLADPAFLQTVGDAIAESRIDPDIVWLEITESTLMSNGEATVTRLAALRDLGVHLAIDDFGTGYSSLSYLKQFPVETLKIDRAFVHDIDHNTGDEAIARAIIALGQTLGMSLIAEGIERPAQANKLRMLGCHLAQGYLYGRPRPAHDFEPFPNPEATTPITQSRVEATVAITGPVSG